MAASTRERTPSLARMRDTWTLAVFSEMNSALADLAVGVPLGHQREDGELALGEPQAVDVGVLGGGVRRASSATRARRARPSTSAASSGARSPAATSAASRSASAAAARSPPPAISASAWRQRA